MPFVEHDGFYRAEAAYVPLLKAAGLVDGVSVFDHPKITVWRSITERENATLDFVFDGTPRRFHIKRDKPAGRKTPSANEAAGLALLAQANIPATPLVAHGRLPDGRSFVITDDLTGYRDAEKLVAGGFEFLRLLEPTARLAARLHRAGLHHRDLYLCHFFVDAQRLGADDAVRLIDTARVKNLPRFFARRWVVKDLAQMIFSLEQTGVGEGMRRQWFEQYTQFLREPASGKTGQTTFTSHVSPRPPLAGSQRINVPSWSSVLKKVTQIARHDASLKRAQPGRGVSLSTMAP